MKKFVLAAICAAGLYCVPCAAQQAVSILWVPAHNAPVLPVLSEVGKNPSFRLTVAIAPENITEPVKLRLKALENDGQVETALRIFGDPPLPLLFSPQSDEVRWPGKNDKTLWSTRLDVLASRIFRECKLFESKFTTEPLGWVPAAGGITPETVSLTKAYSMKWVAAGTDADGVTPVAGDDDTSVVPFTLLTGTASFAALVGGRETDTVFAVIDETLPRAANAPDPRQTLLEIMRSSATWKTVSQALQGGVYKASIDTETPNLPWTGDYALWAGTGRQQGAFRAIDDVLRNYGIYANSAGSNAAAARAIQGELDAMESSDSLLVLGSTVPETGVMLEEKFKARLKNIYRKMNRPIPPALSQPFSAGNDTGAEPAGTPQSASMKSGPGWLAIENPAKELKLPESLKNATPSAFAVGSVSVSWTDTAITFTLKSASGTVFPRQFLADLYIDQNHRARSGMTELLDGRGGLKTAPEDAWEFALSVYNGDARFYQATPDKALYRRSYPVAACDGGITFAVPRADLRGNPENWGYCVLVMAADHSANDVIYPVEFADRSAGIDTITLDRLGSTLYFFRLPKKL